MFGVSIRMFDVGMKNNIYKIHYREFKRFFQPYDSDNFVINSTI